MSDQRPTPDIAQVMEVARAELDDFQLSVAWHEPFRRPLAPDLHANYHDVCTIVTQRCGPVSAQSLSAAAARVLIERYAFKHLALAMRFGFSKKLLADRIAETASDVLEPDNHERFEEIYYQRLWEGLIAWVQPPLKALRDSELASDYGEEQWRRAMVWLVRNVPTDDVILFLVAPKTKGMPTHVRAAPEDGFLSFAHIALALRNVPTKREINRLETRAGRLRKKFESIARGEAL